MPEIKFDEMEVGRWHEFTLDRDDKVLHGIAVSEGEYMYLQAHDEWFQECEVNSITPVPTLEEWEELVEECAAQCETINEMGTRIATKDAALVKLVGLLKNAHKIIEGSQWIIEAKTNWMSIDEWKNEAGAALKKAGEK